MKFARYPSLRTRACLVTGGASGIGASTVDHFAAQGARVAFIDKNPDAAKFTAAQIQEKHGVQVHYRICDLQDLQNCLTKIDELNKVTGPFQVLVNNAGNDSRGSIDDVSLEDWNFLMNVNLRHVFFLSRHFASRLPANQTGSIVNVGSIVWQKGAKQVTVYATAKAGLLGLTKCLAREYGPRQITVNAVAPGWVITEKQAARVNTSEKDAFNRTLDAQAIPLPIAPDDIARFILWLAADDNRICTGQIFNLDAGVT